MIERQQRFCVWAGMSFAPLLVIGLVIAGFLQPPSPQLDAAAIARMFTEHNTRIRIGIWIATAASPLLAFFAWMATMAVQMHRVSRQAQAVHHR